MAPAENLGSEAPTERLKKVIADLWDAQCENKCCSLFRLKEGLTGHEEQEAEVASS